MISPEPPRNFGLLWVGQEWGIVGRSRQLEMGALDSMPTDARITHYTTHAAATRGLLW